MFNFFKIKKDNLKNLVQNNKNKIICKCCNNQSEYIGSVDFNKNCEELHGLKMKKYGLEIFYHKCEYCGFVFTDSFKYFKSSHWEKYVYNDDYIKVDPDFKGERAKNFSQLVKQMFPNDKKIEMLDFGGGRGYLEKEVRTLGYEMDTYDPFSEKNNIKPSKKYKMIFSFEVVEHSPDPKGTFEEMFELLENNGIIVFSTLLQPEIKEENGVLNWWYLAPRNGHISMHTPKSLAHSIPKNGYVVAPFGQGLHIVFKPNNIPSFASEWFKS